MHLEHPANDWRPAIRVSWYQSGNMPESPALYLDLKKIGHGAMFEGSKGTLVADFNTRVLLPARDKADVTYYKPRATADLIPPLGEFQKEWINACKGSLKTSCDFEYGGNLIEQMLLGLVAYRVGQNISYDGAAGRITDNPEATALLDRNYRPGWTLNG